MLPFLIFLGCGAADIGITYIQRVLTLRPTHLPSPRFAGASAVVSAGLLLVRGEHNALRHLRTWIGGVVLGVVNYATLLFLVQALDVGSLAASVIFPTMNIFAILFATATALLLFRERLSVCQWVGIVLCVSALIRIMSGT